MSQNNVHILMEKVNYHMKVNKQLEDYVKRLQVCLNSWKSVEEQVPTKSIGECILTALYNHLIDMNRNNSKLPLENNADTLFPREQNQLGSINDSNITENNDFLQSSSSPSKKCSIAISHFTQLLHYGRNQEAFSLVSNYGEENGYLLTQLFNACEVISRNQRQSDILQQFVVNIFQKDIETTDDNNTGQNQANFTFNFLKRCIPVLLENGYDNLLMKWMKRNISMINEAVADTIFKSHPSNIYIIEHCSYIYEKLSENILNKITKSGNDKNKIGMKLLETLTRCRTKCLHCLLIVRKINHLLKLLDIWGLRSKDTEISLEYSEKELFQLLLKCNCPYSAYIFYNLLKNGKILWKSFGSLLEEQIENNGNNHCHGNIRVTVLLGDILDILLKEVEIQDHHKILEMTVQKLEIKSLSFWKYLLENNPSEFRDVCKICEAFEVLKVRYLHIRRMVHLVQLATAGLLAIESVHY
ncbi:unnamed protein product [Heterobilharzia americana]|nr:unnamed protein product [Heterobilharzia americana]